MHPIEYAAIIFGCVLFALGIIFIVNPLCKELHPLPWQGVTGRRVFGIGLPRTGTSSLSTALELMGLRTWHAPPLTHGRNIRNWIRRFHALTDVHTVSETAYRDLLREQPDGLFILTTRQPQGWYQSVQSFYNNASLCSRLVPGYTRMRSLALSLRPGDLEEYDREVISYFRRTGRAHQLLVLDVSENDAWERLARFLRVSTSPRPFPHTGPVGRHAWQSILYFFD